MKKNNFRQKLSILLIIPFLLGLSFAFAYPVQVQAEDLLEVYVWNGTNYQLLNSDALFDEDNFLPGQSVSKKVKIKNLSLDSEDIGVEAINFSGAGFNQSIPADVEANSLSRYLILDISNTSSIFSGTLFSFYEQGELTLISGLTSGTEEEFIFEITYPSPEEEQEVATTAFDLLFGALGEENGQEEDDGNGDENGTEGNGSSNGDLGSTNGGGGPYRGLTISGEESEVAPVCTTAVISWQTNYFSTSQVIYDDDPNQFNFGEGPENYGYQDYKEGDTSGIEKVTFHQVELTGLEPGTTYYYRCVSHASPATISQEGSFATCVLTGDEPVGEESGLEEGTGEEGTGGGTGETGPGIAGVVRGIAEAGAEEGEGAEEEAGPEETTAQEEEEEKEEKAGNFLAGIAGLLGDIGSFCWILTLIITLLVILYLLIRRSREKYKENKGKGKKYYWDLIVPLIILIILLFLLKCYPLLIPILILAVYLFYQVFIKKEKRINDLDI